MSIHAQLDALYRQHGHVVLRRARHILGSDADAGEVLHDVFVSLAHAPEQFAGRSAMTTFLYAMTTNACLNLLRNRRRQGELLGRELGRASAAGGATAEARMIALDLLAQMPERLARVAIHYFVDEMTHEEIAEILGVSRRQVGNLVKQAQEEVRRCAKVA